MKIIVRNLGPIKEEANIDLKPLTVFIGPNNAGKTWLAYALAGIFGSYGMREYARAYVEEQVPAIYEPLNNAIRQVLAEGNATIDLVQFANNYGNQYFNAVANFARNWMHRFLSTKLTQFDDVDISVSLIENKAQFLSRISQYSQVSSIAIGPKGSLLTIRKRQGEDKLFVYTSIELQDAGGQEEQIGERIPPEVVKERLVSFVSTVLRRSLYPQIRIFPTERTTLVSARFRERVRELPRTNEKWVEALEILTKLSKELTDVGDLTEQSNLREAMWPIGSFINMLGSIFKNGTREREEREKNANSDPFVQKYIELAEILEKQILNGSVDFSTSEPDPSREVLFQQSQDVTLEIPIASSMVKELSPLVLYLRHLARPGELLIIDEPEMNLHPAAQVKIIEFLAMLVNAGLNVLITTHSTYIVDHLINLMSAYQHDNQDEIVDMFLLEQKEAFIAQDKVSVYQIEDGKVENILDSDGNIHWKTFSDVTKYIQQLHFDL